MNSYLDGYNNHHDSDEDFESWVRNDRSSNDGDDEDDNNNHHQEDTRLDMENPRTINMEPRRPGPSFWGTPISDPLGMLQGRVTNTMNRTP